MAIIGNIPHFQTYPYQKTWHETHENASAVPQGIGPGRSRPASAVSTWPPFLTNIRSRSTPAERSLFATAMRCMEWLHRCRWSMVNPIAKCLQLEKILRPWNFASTCGYSAKLFVKSRIQIHPDQKIWRGNWLWMTMEIHLHRFPGKKSRPHISVGCLLGLFGGDSHGYRGTLDSGASAAARSILLVPIKT